MKDVHRRYLALEHGIGSAVINFVLNGAIAWAMFRSLDVVPLWGPTSISRQPWPTNSRTWPREMVGDHRDRAATNS